MADFDDLVMQRENRDVKYEYAMWIEDVAQWQTEHHTAAAWLADVQAAWKETELALQTHAREIHDHKVRLQEHEKTIAEHWCDGSKSEHQELNTEHRDLKAKHLEALYAHQQLKKHHEAVMAEIRELLKTALSGAVVTETLA